MTVIQSVDEHSAIENVSAREHRRPWLAISGALILIAVAAYAFANGSAAWTFLGSEWGFFKSGYSAHVLSWMAAMIPGAIILQHGIYLGGSRRKYFSQALGQVEESKRKALEELYFGYVPIAVRYAIPSLVVTLACGIMMTALAAPGCYAPWLYVNPQTNGQVATMAQLCDVGKVLQLPPPWSAQILSGAALGFVGAYVYMLILLADRARQRDVTTGIAIWSAAMPVLGPLMGGVAALLITTGTGSQQGSFTQYAVFFVAGMLPRQFALFVQSGVSKMFQTTPQVAFHVTPLATLRGVGPEVQSRLEEEGIFDVSALAYASPHQLMRTTTYSSRQIVDWIDESLLIVNMPAHWESIEKLGITGAMDLAWYQTTPSSIKDLASELKLPEVILGNVIARLWQDAQVQDLYKLYWDHTGPPPSAPSQTQTGTQAQNAANPDRVVFTFKAGIDRDARERLLADVKTMDGVTTAAIDGDRLVVTIGTTARPRILEQLSAKPELQVESEGT